MSKVDELLGRLETTTVKFDIGMGGGVPELTAQDIAAALGMCTDKFAIMIYVAMYGGTINTQTTLDAIMQVQWTEWRRRADALRDAQIYGASVGPSRLASRRLETAQLSMWPALIEDTYARMRFALIHELRSNRICTVCNGRREVKVFSAEHNRTDVIACMNCGAGGRIAISDRQRANFMGMNESSYRRTWRAAYEWMYEHLNDAVYRGHSQFSAALGRSKS